MKDQERCTTEHTEHTESVFLTANSVCSVLSVVQSFCHASRRL